MSRKKFIETNGATGRNWRWSWAFVNHADRFVIFGAWDIASHGSDKVILNEDWEFNLSSGRRQPAYSEALEYIALVERQGYELKVFRMCHTPVDPNKPRGTAHIKSFEPILINSKLFKHGRDWIALRTNGHFDLPGENGVETASNSFLEGGKRLVSVSQIERSSKARAQCIQIHGVECKICGFDFSRVYGEIGAGFIHAHHLYPFSANENEVEVDPETDLLPVCPNCHAMLHRRKEPFSPKELENFMRSTSSREKT